MRHFNAEFGFKVRSQLSAYSSIIQQNWNQLLLVVKATAQKHEISKFYPQIQRTDASDHI